MSEAVSASGGTSLITTYIQSGADLGLISEKLITEQSTTQNIKNKTVRKDTTAALKSALYLLKNYKLN